MKRTFLLYALAGSATALSQLVSTWRSWEVAPTLAGGVAVGLLASALLGAMGWLGFILYEADWEAGQVRRHIGLYEWVLARQTGGPSAGSQAAHRQRRDADPLGRSTPVDASNHDPSEAGGC